VAIQRFAGDFTQPLQGRQLGLNQPEQLFLAPSQDALLIAQQQEQQRTQFPGNRVGASTR
jgi:hypothetical protein